MAKPKSPVNRVGKKPNQSKALPNRDSDFKVGDILKVAVVSISVLAAIFVFNFMTGGLHSFLLDRHKFAGESASLVASGRYQAESLIQQYVHDVGTAGITVSGQPLTIGYDSCDKESHTFMSNPDLSNYSYSCSINENIYIATTFDPCNVASALLATHQYDSNGVSCSQSGSTASFTLLDQPLPSATAGPSLFDKNSVRIEVRQTNDFKNQAVADLSSDSNGAFVSCQSSSYLVACKEVGSKQAFQKFIASLPADIQSVIDINVGNLSYYIQH